MMKSIAAAIVVVGLLVSFPANAQEKLREVFKPCFGVAIRETETCNGQAKCSPKKINAKLEACVAKQKLKPDWCNYRQCFFRDASSTFQQTHGCQLRIETNLSDGGNDAIISKKAGSKEACFAGGINLGEAGLHVEDATLDENKHWQFALQPLPLSFDKFIAPKQIDPIELSDFDYIIQKYSDGYKCNGSKSQDDEFKNGKLVVRKDLCPSRHFTGRNGTTRFSFISKFATKGKVKLCGIEIAPQTKMGFRFDRKTILATGDGAVSLSGFSSDQFPDLKKNPDDPTYSTVVCRPGTGVDWNSCSCRLDMTDHEFQNMP